MEIELTLWLNKEAYKWMSPLIPASLSAIEKRLSTAPEEH